MILVYVNDILVVSKYNDTAIDYLANTYVLKESCVGPTDQYFVDNTRKVRTANGSNIWAMHSTDYCKAAIMNLEKTLSADDKKLS